MFQNFKILLLYFLFYSAFAYSEIETDLSVEGNIIMHPIFSVNHLKINKNAQFNNFRLENSILISNVSGFVEEIIEGPEFTSIYLILNNKKVLLPHFVNVYEKEKEKISVGDKIGLIDFKESPEIFYMISSFSDFEEFNHKLFLSNQEGVPVFSPVIGNIIDSGYDRSLGLFLTIETDCYLFKLCNLGVLHKRKDQSVDLCELIGRSGNTGDIIEPGLSFKIYKEGKLLDPYIIYYFIE